MFWFLIVVEVIISILLMVVVLMQSSKGGGLTGTFGGGQVGMMFGVRRATDFLTRATQVLAITFGLLALIINVAFLPGKSGAEESVIQGQQGSSQQQLPPTSAPPGTGGR